MGEGEGKSAGDLKREIGMIERALERARAKFRAEKEKGKPEESVKPWVSLAESQTTGYSEVASIIRQYSFDPKGVLERIPGGEKIESAPRPPRSPRVGGGWGEIIAKMDDHLKRLRGVKNSGPGG